MTVNVSFFSRRVCCYVNFLLLQLNGRFAFVLLDSTAAVEKSLKAAVNGVSVKQTVDVSTTTNSVVQVKIRDHEFKVEQKTSQGGGRKPAAAATTTGAAPAAGG